MNQPLIGGTKEMLVMVVFRLPPGIDLAGLPAMVANGGISLALGLGSWPHEITVQVREAAPPVPRIVP